jgi:uncharacterized protein (TIGR00255 family)
MPQKQALMSMTGFAATQGSLDGWSWTVEIRGVNGRSLDIRLRIPDVEGLEPELRKRVQARLSRGNVTVNVRLQRAESAAAARLSEPGLTAALDLVKRVEAAADKAGLPLAPLKASDIAAMRGVLEAETTSGEDDGALRNAILKGAEACMDAFVADRGREGAALASVLAGQIDRIEALTADAALAMGDRETAQRAAMTTALKRLLETTDMADEGRVAQELALIAVKTDVTEELDRLAAHVTAARELIVGEGPMGRKLDFLMQEFNREANTLCSKAQSSQLTAIGLDLKTVIDQMREQVQNIE